MPKPVSQMTDEEIAAELNLLQGGQKFKPVDQMTDAEIAAELSALEAQQMPAEKSFGQQALEGIGAAAEFVDKYTGAPTRAAIGELIPSRPRMPAPKQVPGVPMGSEFLGTGVTAPPAFGGGSVVKAAQAFGEQFGEDPSKAPTGKELATRMGASTEETLSIPGTEFTFSPAGAAGLTIEMLADPLNFIPFSAAGRVVSKTASGAKSAAKAGVKAATKEVVETTAKGAKVAKEAPTIQATKEAAKSTADKIKNIVDGYINPKQAPNYKRMKATAEKNGIDPKTLPDQVEFGAESALGKLSRSQAELDINSELAQKYIKSIENTENALDKRITTIGKVGRPPDAIEAGNVILDGVQKTFDSIFGDFAVTYKQLTDRVPGLALGKDASEKMIDRLEGILVKAEQRARIASVGAEAAQARQVADNVYKILELGENMDDLVLKLHSVGNAGYVSKFARGIEIAPDEKAFREIYDVLKDAIIESVDEIDPRAAADLIDTNKNISNFLNARKPIESILTDGRKAPEAVFNALVANGDSQKIAALKEVLSVNDFAALKSSYLENLVKRNAEGYVSWKQTANKLLANKRENLRLSQMLDEAEVKDVSELLELGLNHGDMILNHSKTSVREFFVNMPDKFKQLFINEQALANMRRRARNLPPTPPAAPSGLRPPVSPGLRPPAAAPAPAPSRQGLLRSLPGRLPISTPLKPFQVREENK